MLGQTEKVAYVFLVIGVAGLLVSGLWWISWAQRVAGILDSILRELQDLNKADQGKETE